MKTMAKRRKPEQPDNQPPESEPRKRPPSRENTRYVALPLKLYEALERYAESRSDQDDRKSVSWAGRVAIRRFLEAEGFYPPAEEKQE